MGRHRLRPCLGLVDAPCGVLTTGSRCPSCTQALDQARGSSTDRGYDYGYQQLAGRVMARHLATFGRICPGWGIDAHPAEKLSVDHIRWPAESEEDLQVLCPGCQNRKGAAR